jgi:hypothetical protein
MGAWDQRFRDAHDYARALRFHTGWPNFHQADYGNGTVYGTHLLPATTVDVRDVPRSTYGVPSRDDVPAMFRAADVYATQNGYAAGVPSFHQADYGAGMVYGTYLVKPGKVDFRDVPATTLGVSDRRDVPAMMRAAANYASNNGYAAAFPTFHEANYGQGKVFGLKLFRQGNVAWRDVPADLLSKYSDAPWPMAIVLCRPTDQPALPGSRNRWQEFFLPGGSDVFNNARYWSELSYGQYSAQGSQVFGWLDIGHTRAEIAALTGFAQRMQLKQWALPAASAAGIDLSRFRTVIFGYNINADHGYTYDNTSVLAYADGRPFEPTFMYHEVAHALGLRHSWSQTGGEYGFRFDIMSATLVDAFAIDGRSGGPGACAFNLEKLGWLHASRVWRGWPATPRTLTLAALNRPAADGFLAARLQGGWQGAPAFYVEYREKTDWDRGLPGARVLVTTPKADGAMIFGGGNDPSGALEAGDELTVEHEWAKFKIRVDSIDTAASQAKVRLWV